ncbi:putative membrane protein, partial [Acinetobacter baumannii 1525283]
MLKYFYGQKIDISFIKDIFSIGATLFAALIAISLF